MKNVWIAAVVTVCAGCESAPEIVPEPSTVPENRPDKVGNVSGSRLRRVDRVGADGSRESAGWYDSERDEDCRFVTIPNVSDQISRCLPGADIENWGASVAFIDRECARAIGSRIGREAPSRKGSPLKRYRLFVGGFDQTVLVRIYADGELFVDAPESDPLLVQLYRVGGSLPCEPLEGVSELRGTWLHLNDADIDSFVAWKEEVD